MITRKRNHIKFFFPIKGSFKIRGVLNQFRNISTKNDTKIVTFSGGNYGKTFAYLASKNKLKAKVIMPESVSEAKFNYIKVRYYTNLHIKLKLDSINKIILNSQVSRNRNPKSSSYRLNENS